MQQFLRALRLNPFHKLRHVRVGLSRPERLDADEPALFEAVSVVIRSTELAFPLRGSTHHEDSPELSSSAMASRSRSTLSRSSTVIASIRACVSVRRAGVVPRALSAPRQGEITTGRTRRPQSWSDYLRWLCGLAETVASAGTTGLLGTGPRPTSRPRSAVRETDTPLARATSGFARTKL